PTRCSSELASTSARSASMRSYIIDKPAPAVVDFHETKRPDQELQSCSYTLTIDINLHLTQSLEFISNGGCQNVSSDRLCALMAGSARFPHHRLDGSSPASHRDRYRRHRRHRGRDRGVRPARSRL